MTLRWDFSDAAPEAEGPGPHPVTFTSTGVYPVTLDGANCSGMRAGSPDQVAVTVDCPGTYPETEVAGLRLAKEACGVRFTWTDVPGHAGDYVVLGAEAAQGPFHPQGSAPSGTTGVLLPLSDEHRFYKVVVRSPEGCLGPS